MEQVSVVKNYDRTFAWKDVFGLHRADPRDFTRSQWSMSDETYQSYRFFFMVYVVVWDIITAIYSIVYAIGRYHLVFLTNWAYHLIAVYGIVAAFSSRHFTSTTASGSRSKLPNVDHSKEVIPDAIVEKQSPIPQPFTLEARKAHGQLHRIRKNLPVSQPAKGLLSPEDDNPCTPTLSSRNPWYCQLTWILFNINTNLAPIISVVYWSLIHDFTSGDKTNIFSLAGISNIQVHTLNTCVVFIDLMVSAYPVKIVHSIFTMGLCLIYVVFSLIYWAAGGLNPMNGTRALYPILNWEKIPGLSCLFLLGMIVIMVLVQCGIYGLYRLKMSMAQRLSSTLESKRK